MEFHSGEGEDADLCAFCGHLEEKHTGEASLHCLFIFLAGPGDRKEGPMTGNRAV
jgi:hypothetical protein